MEKNLERKYTYVYVSITESLCCTPKTNIVNQLYFIKIEKKNAVHLKTKQNKK